MRTTVTVLLPLVFLLVVLAPAEAREDCTYTILDLKGQACDRAICSFNSRVAFAQLGCPKPSTSCSWKSECTSAGCNFTYCMYS
ncbi:hypothetical protein ZWY2020_001906 [Hordeum vulgare]|nr:hypothetical protein ZWY2020_001906 [Hordeum vulgare]